MLKTGLAGFALFTIGRNPLYIKAMDRLAILLFWLMASAASAESVTVAVASNFLVTARDIAAAFEAETGHEVEIAHGSTGKLFAQIRSGAPFDVFLSADAARPERLAEVGLAVDVRPYAIGRLALVHGPEIAPGDLDEILGRADIRFAIADPAVAPYGAAARDVLRARRGDTWDADLVLGESVGQAFTFVVTGNADAGLVALAQPRTYEGEIWVLEIGDSAHQPIRQDAALLTRSADRAEAQAFYEFLRSEIVRLILLDAGYEVPG